MVEKEKKEVEVEEKTEKSYWAEINEKLCAVFKCHKFCSVICAIMLFGIIVFFYNAIAGGILIGCALGSCYVDSIKHGLTKFYSNFKNETPFHKFFLIVVSVSLLLTIFPLIIGGIIGIGIRSLTTFKPCKCEEPKKKKTTKPEE